MRGRALACGIKASCGNTAGPGPAKAGTPTLGPLRARSPLTPLGRGPHKMWGGEGEGEGARRASEGPVTRARNHLATWKYRNVPPRSSPNRPAVAAPQRGILGNRPGLTCRDSRLSLRESPDFRGAKGDNDTRPAPLSRKFQIRIVCIDNSSVECSIKGFLPIDLRDCHRLLVTH